MEAPEKIYMPTELLSEDWTKHIEGEDIEYTRTDAFIERACEFMETYPHMFMGVMRTEMIEDFKNYMKGE